MTASATEALVFCAYLLALALLSILSMRRTSDTKDYWIAGGQLGWLRGGATLAATHASAGTFVGTVGVIYGVGWSFTWLVLSIPLAYWFNAAILAPRFARQRELTVPSFLERRYESPALRRLGAIVVLIATVVYIQAQIVAGGLIARVVFDISPLTGMFTFTIIMILYTLAGGMVAVVMTDLAQLAVMGIGALLAVPLALRHFAASHATASDDGSHLDVLLSQLQQARPDALSWGAMPTPLLFSMGVAFTLGSIATPEKLVRFYAMRDQRAIRRGVLLAMIIATCLNLLVFVLALIAMTIFPELPAPDLAMPLVARTVLPPVLASLLLAAIVAAMMSTVDSLLLVAGAAVAEDLLRSSDPKPGVDPDLARLRALRASRFGVIIVGLAPLLLLLTGVGEGELIQFIVLLFSALMGACFFMPVVVGIYWRRANRTGATASMIGGLVATFTWKLWGSSGLDPVVAGFTAAAVGMILGTYLRPDQRHDAAFDLYQPNARQP